MPYPLKSPGGQFCLWIMLPVGVSLRGGSQNGMMQGIFIYVLCFRRNACLRNEGVTWGKARMSPELHIGHSGKGSCCKRKECFENVTFCKLVVASYLWKLGWSARKNLGPCRQGTNWKVSGWNWNLGQNMPCLRSLRGSTWHSQKRISFRWLLNWTLNSKAS